MFTKEYIEMVINNKQIQDLCKYNKGDWLIHTRYKELPFVLSENASADECYNYCTDSYKWLPTLEDLFGILRIDDSVTFDIFFKAITNFYWKKISRDYNADSLQEMLLRIVMLNIFHKIWNPDKKEWEEINGS